MGYSHRQRGTMRQSLKLGAAVVIATLGISLACSGYRSCGSQLSESEVLACSGSYQSALHERNQLIQADAFQKRFLETAPPGSYKEMLYKEGLASEDLKKLLPA